MNCIYFSTLFLFRFQRYTEGVFMFGIYLVPVSINKFKRQIMLFLSYKTVFSVLKLAQMCCMNNCEPFYS